jgi:hypothetical protein
MAERLRARLNDDAHRAATDQTLRRIATHELDPYTGADDLLSGLGDSARASRT